MNLIIKKMKFTIAKCKLNVKIYLKKENISIFILILVSQYFFWFFELLLISVFYELTFIDLTFFLMWQSAAIALNILVLYLGIRYKIFRIFYYFIIIFISIIAFAFIIQLKALLFLKVYIITFLVIGIVGFYLSIKYFNKTKNFNINKKKEIFFLFLLIFLFSSSVYVLNSPKHEITIKPRTNPELIFWVDPYFLPNDEEIYQICKEYNIAFMPAIGSHTLNKSSLMDRYKLAIANEINLYFLLITPPDAFINMDNTGEYLSLYNEFRQWFINEGIFESPCVKSFAVDAEPPSHYTNKVRDSPLVESVNYFVDEYPTQKEIEEASRDLKELTEEIRSDGKEVGIVRISSYMDQLDGDGDIELYLRNIYSINVVWDYTTTMIYRVGRIVPKSGETADVIIENSKENVFGQLNEDVGEKNVLSAYNFYFRVGMCQNNREEIKAANHYVFIGTLKSIFNDTDYMKYKEYLNDLDICRHFGTEKVFLYNYKNFIDNYGVNELINLGKHNQQKKSWKLEYRGTELQFNIMFYLALAFLDRLLYF